MHTKIISLVLVLLFLTLNISVSFQLPTLPAAFPAKSAPSFISVGPNHGITQGQVEGIHNKYVAGSVNRVLPHPTDANILYAGSTNGGVWKTTNAKNSFPTWTALTDNLPSLSIGGLNFDWSDNSFNTIVAAIGADSSLSRLGGLHVGVIKTTDGGNTWNVLGTEDLYGYRLQGVAASGANIAACAVGQGYGPLYVNGGIFSSTNNGQSFQRVGLFPCTDMIIDHLQPNNFYAASLSDGILQSTNGGVSWTVITPPGLYAQKFNVSVLNIRLALHHSTKTNQKVLYAGFLNADLLALYRIVFDNDKKTWDWIELDKPVTNDNGTINGLNPQDDDDDEGDNDRDHDIGGGQGSIHFSITADPNNPNIVYVGGDRQPSGVNGTWPNGIGAMDYDGRLFRLNATKPKGEQYVPLTHIYAGNHSAPHADSRNMNFDADGNIIESDDGGVYKRFSPQTTTGSWVSLNGNLQVLEAHSVTLLYPDTFITGNQDTGTTGGPAGKEWSSVGKGDGGVVRSFYDKAKKQNHFYWTYPFFGLFNHYIVNEGSTNGTNIECWLNITGTTDSMYSLKSLSFYQNYALNRFDPNRLFFGITFDDGAYESFDGAQTVHLVKIKTDGSKRRITAQIYGAMNDGVEERNTTIVGGVEFIAIRKQGDSQFKLLQNFPPSGILIPNVAEIAVHPNNWKQMAVLFTYGEVALTNDGGNTWKVVPKIPLGTFTQPDSAQTEIVIVPTTPQQTVLVAGRTGVYMLDVAEQNWWRLSGLPNAYVFDMRYEPNTDMLYLSTLGRGVYYITKASEAFQNANGVFRPPETNLSIYIYVLGGVCGLLGIIVIVLAICLFRKSNRSEYSSIPNA